MRAKVFELIYLISHIGMGSDTLTTRIAVVS